jgi:hypothetical protein
MERYDIVEATFEPTNTDDLKPGVAEFIGYRGQWTVAWMIDEEDGGAYVGQYAMTPHDFKMPYVWVPECDLANCTPVSAVARALKR